MNRELSTLMDAFARYVGLPELEPDGEGTYCLLFDDYVITIRCVDPPGRAPQMLMHAHVGFLPAARREERCLELLRANVLFSGTDGATLAADEESSLVSLQRAVPLWQLDLASFVRILESFVAYTVHWTEACSVPVGGRTEAPDADEEPGRLARHV